VEDTLQEVPEERQQEVEEEEDAAEDAPSVGAAAMATEVLGVWEGVVATPAASSTPPWLFADPSASSAATRTIATRRPPTSHLPPPSTALLLETAFPSETTLYRKMDHLRRHLRSYLPSARKKISERRELAIIYQRIPLVETVTCSKDRRLERNEASLGIA
jgi:hypothetical protein